MISKLRATGGAGFDLVQPSQDRIAAVQAEFGIYKPFDLAKVKLDEFQPGFLEIVRKNTTVDGQVYGLPYLWGTDGLVVNTKRAKIADYGDLCRADLKGKTAIRLRAPDTDGVRVRIRQGSVRALRQYQGVLRAHGPGRRGADRLQVQLQVLLRQQGSIAEWHSLR
jgi:hypothetical protein